jgi:nucleotide-binding universal stress UspA family protein
MREKVINPLRILVPLDGSSDAESVMAAVLPLAQKTPIRLKLLSAVAKNTRVRSTESYLASAERALRVEGVEVVVQTCVGEPVAAILRHATPEKADFIAMTTHGRSGLSRLVMGSVAEEVVRHAEIPLLVSRPRGRMEGWTHVVTLDGSPQSETVLEDLLPLTRLLGASLHLLYVDPGIPIFGSRGGSIKARAAEARSYLEQWADQARARAVTVTVAVRRGQPGPEILHYVSGVRAALVGMATHGRTGLSRAILGSVTEAVLRKLPCPALLRRVSGPSKPIEAGTVPA